ncbi:MAG: SH3 domain-containing protein, partial [Phototrophicaceae bacterium]
NLLFDNIDATGLQTFTGIAFVGSGAASIILDYVDYGGAALIEITWDEISESLFSTSEPTDGQGGGNFAPPTVATGQVNGSVTGLALRTGPYLGASLVAVLRPGQDYEVIAQNNTESDITWYKVVVNDQGQTGWASGRFLDVNLGNITQSDCAVPPSGGLNIAQTFVPNFSDAGVATSCITNVANVLNASVGSSFTPEQFAEVVRTCAAFGLNENTPLGGLISFVDKAKLVFDLYGVCTTVASCNLPEVLTLELASQITPNFSGSAFEAFACFDTLIEFFGGSISQQALLNLTASCAPFIITDPTSIAVTTNSSILSFINAVSSLICSTSSIPTIVLPEETSVFENLTILPDTGVTIAPRSVMNIRVRPSTRTAEVGNLPWGAEAQLLARTVQAGTDHWYLIRYGGIIGWVDASFINVRGNITDVPIY